MLIYDEHQNELHRMNGFSGTGLSDKLEISRSIVPMPILQAGLGVDKGTDLKLRYIPHRSLGDVKVHGWGLGLQHNLTHHMNAGNWDMSVLVGYNRLGAEYKFSEEEDKLLATRLSSLTSQLILSKRLAILTLFATGGYHSGKVNFDLLGSYEISTEEIFVDPIRVQFQSGNPFASMGARIKLGPVFASAEYTFQQYKVLTAGVGISIAERRSQRKVREPAVSVSSP
jgi:hypothetical protein